jgi:hypothetical protein
MVLASWTQVAAIAPGAFVVGLLVGWVAAQRWALVRRNGERRKAD